MLIINADDWGRSVGETDAALRCHNAGRITSVSAMVFMADSERAAELAKENGIDAGLHLNFSESFTGKKHSDGLSEYHDRIMRFLRSNKYAQVFYNPFLRKAFSYSCRAQIEEFQRLFGAPPSHIDGHHHMHLCTNMLLSNLLAPGTKVRRSFSFWPREKSLLNRAYRAMVDYWLSRRYRLTNYFFDLTQCVQEKRLSRVTALARSSEVELMTHPVFSLEQEYLMSDAFCEFRRLIKSGGSYAALT